MLFNLDKTTVKISSKTRDTLKKYKYVISKDIQPSGQFLLIQHEQYEISLLWLTRDKETKIIVTKSKKHVETLFKKFWFFSAWQRLTSN